MKTLTQVQVTGMRVERKVSLEHGGPHGNERSMPLQPPGASEASRFIAQDSVDLSARNKLVSPDIMASARRTLDQGEVALLGPEDFRVEPTVTRFTEGTGALRHGGPGGYPYQEKTYQTFESVSLTDFVRQATGFPNATWGIKPQTKSYPDVPELYVFVPVEGFDGRLSEADVNGLVFGRLGEPTPPSATPSSPAGVRVEDDAVFIGNLRIDRKHYVIHLEPTVR